MALVHRSGRGRSSVTVKLDDVAGEMRSLLDVPSPAVLTLHRSDGEAIVSPVWFRVRDGWFEIVLAATDHKLAQVRRDPSCVLLIFEANSSFRGVQVRGRATLTPEDGAQVRLAVA